MVRKTKISNSIILGLLLVICALLFFYCFYFKTIEGMSVELSYHNGILPAYVDPTYSIPRSIDICVQDREVYNVTVQVEVENFQKQYIGGYRNKITGKRFLKKIFGDIGGGKTRTALANIVGVVLAIALNKGDCITPSYILNSQYVINEEGAATAVVLTDAIKEKVREFIRWYIALTEDIKKQPTAKKITKGLFAKISGLLALILLDWLDGLAKDRRAMWIDFALKLNDDKMYEKRVCNSLPIGVLSNNSGENFRKRIQCIFLAYEKRGVVPIGKEEEFSDEEEESYESGED
jgi:hypothetical protein